jgi:hypothetical protein
MEKPFIWKNQVTDVKNAIRKLLPACLSHHGKWPPMIDFCLVAKTSSCKIETETMNIKTKAKTSALRQRPRPPKTVSSALETKTMVSRTYTSLYTAS